MEALISNIKFERINDDNCYWKLTIVDKEGNYIGTFGNPLLSDPVNFRKQTFGILSACNCYDLLTLSSKEPKSLSILFEETNHQTVKSISNMSGQTLSLGDNGTYVVNKAWNWLNKNKQIKKRNVGNIKSILSSSGTFGIMIKAEYFTTFYVTGQVYYGFGYPLSEYTDFNENYVMDASKLFKSFIESILKLYETEDLLRLSGNKKIEYPEVTIKKDELGNIVSIGCSETGFTLVQNTDCYSITNSKVENLETDSLTKSKKI